MIINDIDLEKEEFVIDLERNIFLIEAEILEQYRLSPAKPDETEMKSLSVSEETPKTYEHKTVFLFNSKAIYDIPCKIASDKILSKDKRNHVTRYIYFRKWADIDPAEIPPVSLFLYDLTETMRENKEKPCVAACSYLISGGTNRTHKPFTCSRTSLFSKSEEKKKVLLARNYLINKIYRPVNTIVRDLAEKGKNEIGFFDGLDDFSGGVSQAGRKNVFFTVNFYNPSSFATHAGSLIDLTEESGVKYGDLADSQSARSAEGSTVGKSVRLLADAHVVFNEGRNS